jgi:hypothetical protein
MDNQKQLNKNILLFIIGLSLFVAVKSNANITMKSLNKNIPIAVGEPLILQISAYLEQSEDINSIDKRLFYQSKIKIIFLKEKTISEVPILMELSPTTIQASGEIKSELICIILYDYFGKKLVFDKVGEYELKFQTSDSSQEGSTKINVIKASSLEEKAISLLSNPTDYYFLMFGNNNGIEDTSESILHLQKVVEYNENILLAKWAAARLGIEYFRKLNQKHPSFETFRLEYIAGNIKEPLLEQSRKYLQIGAELPDEFPLRQEDLLNLSKVEFMEDNLKKAVSIIDEIATKYQYSKYGTQAIKAQKEEVPKLKAQFSERFVEEAHQLQTNKPLGAAFPITIGLAVVVIAVGGFLIYKRKSKTRQT